MSTVWLHCTPRTHGQALSWLAERAGSDTSRHPQSCPLLILDLPGHLQEALQGERLFSGQAHLKVKGSSARPCSSPPAPAQLALQFTSVPLPPGELPSAPVKLPLPWPVRAGYSVRTLGLSLVGGHFLSLRGSLRIPAPALLVVKALGPAGEKGSGAHPLSVYSPPRYLFTALSAFAPFSTGVGNARQTPKCNLDLILRCQCYRGH